MTLKSNIKWLALPIVVLNFPAYSAEKIDLFELTIDELMDVKVVSSTQNAQFVRKAPSVIDVFTRRQIELFGAESLIELLQYSAGIEASLAPNGFYRVAIRGERKDGNILFLFNGQKLNDLYNGQAIFNFPTSLIEQVEIIRGPGSALYGSNAVSGVINIIPRKTNDSIGIEAGSHDKHALSLHRVFDGAARISTTLGYRESKGDLRSVTARNFASSESYSSTTNHFLDNTYLSTNIDYENWNASFYFSNYENGDWGGPSFNLGTNSDFKTTSYHLNLSKRFTLSSNSFLTPKFYISLFDHNFLYNDLPIGFTYSGNVFDEGGFTREKYKANSQTFELDWTQSISDEWQLISGLLFEHQKLDDYSFSRNYSAISLTPFDIFDNHDNASFEQDNRTRKIQALYSQARYVKANFEMTLGARLDDYSDFGSSFNPRVGVVYDINSNVVVKALFASAFRAPTLKELYDITLAGNNGVRGNEDLKPEKVNTLELVTEYSTKDLIFRVNGFFSKTNSVIGIYDQNGSGSQAVYENIGDSESFGIELELKMTVNDYLSIYSSFGQHRTDFFWSKAALFSEERIYQNTRGHTQLVHTPRIRANFQALFNFSSWSLSLGAHYGGKSGPNDRTVIESFRGVRGDNVVIDDYLLGDIALNYQLSENNVLTLRAINLGDDKYSDPDESSNISVFGSSGLIQPGEALSLKWRYQL
ncbi:TonB-dependent receptor plug domain-containing protein [Pleionea sediminis]|uniref:TonB-dependent receptor plug domain-containing protein n=1 Tax=Pleionea sediminis TaxID=2569479 RepID=UPI0011867A9F|nr:TonB-dependent receptor [Pleionea sediminis]